MKSNAKRLAVRGVVKRLGRGEIDLAPDYQRGKVWSKKRQAMLIDSMLRGFDLPKFYVRDIGGENYEVVDGQQRLTAIAAFLNDEIPLPPESITLGSDLPRQTYKQLPSSLQDVLDEYLLDFTVLENADDEQIREMFMRLQMGVRLNTAEELNAVSGGMHDYIEDLSKLKLFDSCVSFSDSRNSYRHVCAQLARLAIVGLGDARKQDLLQMYKSHAQWMPDDKAKALRQVIDWSASAFSEHDPLLRNRGQTVTFIYAINSLWSGMVFQGHEDEVRNAFAQFDQQVLSDDPTLQPYKVALSHSSDQKRSVELRHHFALAAIARFAPGLPLKDSNRAFNQDERAAMYYRDGGVCQHPNCGKEVSFAQFHADHVMPYAKGGKTTLANAQVLCAFHNLAKGAST